MIHVYATMPDGLADIGSDLLGTRAGAVTGLGYSPTMAVRPSQRWREGVEQDEREIEAGILGPEDGCMAALFPESLLTRTDEVLAAFEAEVAALNDPSDEQVFAAVRNVVLALNQVNREHGGAGYETGEREQLCDYIDKTLAESGIDVPALAERNDLGRYAITDRWRTW